MTEDQRVYQGINPAELYEKLYTWGNIADCHQGDPGLQGLTGSQTVVCGDFLMSGVNEAAG
jgi:hypothetical protein